MFKYFYDFLSNNVALSTQQALGDPNAYLDSINFSGTRA